jgi:lysophospholipid acyltransferase (LPLAT)-like uncharacterized protein
MSAGMQIMAVTGATLVRALGLSWRMQIVGFEYEEAARAHAARVIYTFWHGRLLPLSWSYRGRSIQVLASEHRDGERLGQVIRRLGFGHVRGSSTRGGARAILELVRKLEEGFDLGITVDGPKGPVYEVKPGPPQIAKLSGCAILPLTTSSRHHKTLSSWDAFEIPHPFTEVRIQLGPPVIVSPDADAEELERKRLELESTLRRITRENDESFGHA